MKQTLTYAVHVGIYAAGLWAEGRRKQRLKFRQITRGLARQMDAVDSDMSHAVHSTQLRAHIAAAAALQPVLLSGVAPAAPGNAAQEVTLRGPNPAPADAALPVPVDGMGAAVVATLERGRHLRAMPVIGTLDSARVDSFGQELSSDQLTEATDRRGALTSRGRLEETLSAARERCPRPRDRPASAGGRIQGTAAQQEADAADEALPEPAAQPASLGVTS